MVEFISLVAVISTLAAFVLTLLQKWGVVEWIQINGNEFFSKMAHCNFCLSFWCSVVLCLVGVLTTGNWMFLVVPFCSTPIVRILL